MSNTRNTPVEAIEHYLPVRIRQYRLRRDSAGAGAAPGGEGIVREYEMLADTSVTMLSDRRRAAAVRRAWAASPAASGATRSFATARSSRCRARSSFRLRAGDRLRIETPGGGGIRQRRMTRKSPNNSNDR